MARWEHRNAPGNPAARAGYLIAVSRLRKALLVIAFSGVAWTNAPPPRGVPASCAPGPERVDQLQMHDGYLRAPRAASGPHNEFYFARAMYSQGGRRGGFGGFGSGWLGDSGPGWSIDYPSADNHMMIVATRLSNLNACEWGQPVSLADPELREYPFVYSLEWGRNADLTEEEVVGLRTYLQAGGFLMLDDFWGTQEWANTSRQIMRVLPDRPIVDIPLDHELFRAYYAMEGPIVQVPGAGGGINGRPTWQRDGYEPIVKGIFDDDGRLMVAIYGNTDLGDALEWAEDPIYPLEYSTYASKLFLNTIMYAMTR
jgi:hypothetical protein